jgi:hypothetical protein
MSQNSRNQDFSNYFCLMMEGSGSVQIMMDLDGPNTGLYWFLNFEDETLISCSPSIFHAVKVKHGKNKHGKKYIYWHLLPHYLLALAELLNPICPLL